MLEKVTQIFKIKELRNKIFFILTILVIYRLAANVPIPGVDTSQLKAFFEGNQLFGMLDMFSGGGLKNISIVMLGVGPYITASIVMQVMTMIFPKLEQLQKEEGEAGRQKYNSWTRYLTVPFAILQVFAMISLFRSQGLIGNLLPMDYITIITTATAGTIFLMWLGELITEKGLGNGVSLLIFAGIVSALPGSIQQLLATWDSSMVLTYFSFLVLSIVTVAGIVVVNEGQRDIPVSFARRTRAGTSSGATKSNLPLRVNQAGVIPIIFAMSIMIFPGMISNLLLQVDQESVKAAAGWMADLFANQVFYSVSYFILVVAFTFFYTSVTFDPKNIAESLQRQGSFIPGIRPGVPTMEYLNYIVNRITTSGALFLGSVAVLPFIVQGITGMKTLTVGGTGVLIVVSVVIETMKQVEAQLVMRDYEGF
ncbi:preprotein translocase subunit SecY [bacterium]|jgi:preprotein translocase subunit SecY|nr:preprotein translocase subunit SecY [bacterium]MBT4251555.1 preprotein translocase subunit SecY [bacterium]MBT4597817.1 preprotein translocase subunit SecY [bacterium]MBT6753541.1 preprotein translocase subunit SecY [bacterium]MBT7037731.1 preprotein translocase subunit SecY [bacterium]